MCVIASIVVHGTTASGLSRRWLGTADDDADRTTGREGDELPVR